jgi:hypothetical protein
MNENLSENQETILGGGAEKKKMKKILKFQENVKKVVIC